MQNVSTNIPKFSPAVAVSVNAAPPPTVSREVSDGSLDRLLKQIDESQTGQVRETVGAAARETERVNDYLDKLLQDLGKLDNDGKPLNQNVIVTGERAVGPLVGVEGR